MLTNICSLLIDKDGHACRNISIQFPCACPTVITSFSGKSFHLTFHYFVIKLLLSRFNSINRELAYLFQYPVEYCCICTYYVPFAVSFNTGKKWLHILQSTSKFLSRPLSVMKYTVEYYPVPSENHTFLVKYTKCG